MPVLIASSGEAYLYGLFFVIGALVVGIATRHLLSRMPVPFTVLLFVFGLALGLFNRHFLIPTLEEGHEEPAAAAEMAHEAESHTAEHAHGEGHAHVHEAAEAHAQEAHSDGGFLSTLSKAIEWGGQLDPHLILYVFLPILIFEAAFAMDVHTFRRCFNSAFYMAGPGIITAMFMTAGIVYLLIQLPLGMEHWADFEVGGQSQIIFLCLLFGAVVSATDPVAVVALLKELGASKKLSTVIEGESLLNDGTAIVLFVVLFAVVTGEQQFDAVNAAVGFGKIGLAGALVGALVACVTIYWIKHIFNDPLAEISLIVVAAYVTFYVAEHFLHVSGVLGLVALGVIMAGPGRTRISPAVEHFLHEFWELAAFIANVLIFIICGVVIAQRTNPDVSDYIVLGLVYVIIHLVRGANIGIFYPFMRKSGYGMNKREATVVWYGGLRGAIGLALALVVASETLHGGVPNPISPLIRDQFLFYISGIVLLTLCVNATTIKPLVNSLGLTKIPAVKARIMKRSFENIANDGERTIEILREDRMLMGADWQRVRSFLPDADEVPAADTEKDAPLLPEIRRRLLAREKNSYWRQFREGLLGPYSVRRLDRMLNDLIDQQGEKPLNERGWESLFRIPTMLGRVQQLPLPVLPNILVHFFEDRMAIQYDVVKGLAVAQEEGVKLVPSVVRETTGEASEEIVAAVEAEVRQLRLEALDFLERLREVYPEIVAGIATKQAVRTILNKERGELRKLGHSGGLAADETDRLIVRIDERIRRLMSTPLKIEPPEPVELLQSAARLDDLPASALKKLFDNSQKRLIEPGQNMISVGETSHSIMLVLRGRCRVLISDQTVDVLGRGSLIGEMAFLTGVARTANVRAETLVEVIELDGKELHEAMKEFPELEIGLWTTAAFRFSENLFSNLPEYRELSQHSLRHWLHSGHLMHVKQPLQTAGDKHLYVLIQGSAEGDAGIQLAPTLVQGGPVIAADSRMLRLEPFNAHTHSH